MSESLKTITINCDTEDTASAAFNLFVGRSSEFREQMNRLLANRGLGRLDTAFQDVNVDTLSLTIASIPVDKGRVFTLNKKGSATLTNYSELSGDDFYGHIDGGQLKVFQFVEDAADQHVHTAGDLKVLEEMLPNFKKQLEDMKAEHAAKEEAAKEAEVVDMEVAKED